jgi:hypothetical protein
MHAWHNGVSYRDKRNGLSMFSSNLLPEDKSQRAHRKQPLQPIPPIHSINYLAGTFLTNMESKVRQRVLIPAQIDSAEQPSLDISDNTTLLQKAKTRVLLLFDELPEWAKDNQYILSGWRPETN